VTGSGRVWGWRHYTRKPARWEYRVLGAVRGNVHRGREAAFPSSRACRRGSHPLGVE